MKLTDEQITELQNKTKELSRCGATWTAIDNVDLLSLLNEVKLLRKVAIEAGHLWDRYPNTAFDKIREFISEWKTEENSLSETKHECLSLHGYDPGIYLLNLTIVWTGDKVITVQRPQVTPIANPDPALSYYLD